MKVTPTSPCAVFKLPKLTRILQPQEVDPMKTSPACRAELDGVVTNIELTLASIVQGLALQFLAQNVG